MKLVILGVPQAGQQELFSLLTAVSLDAVKQRPMEVQQGICNVLDPRIAQLCKLYNPKKTAYARIEYMLLPDFNLAGPAKELIFKQLKNAEEFCWVTRFENAEADIASFLSELLIADQMLVEKRLESIAKEQKRKFSDLREKEKALMEKCLVALEQEKPISSLEFDPDDIKNIRTYQLFTMKPVILVINVSEDQIKDKAVAENIEAKFSYPTVSVCAELEAEIGQLEEPDKSAYMKEVGIESSALEKMTLMAFKGLGLMSFFTVGEDEVRAWTVRIGSTAPEAGGAIHSDIAKGFVRAEMCRYGDLLEAGSEAKLKEIGKFHLKGRDYIVQDGDCLSFRFNV